jgi:transcriptional regulator with XRE-family HTH domain
MSPLTKTLGERIRIARENARGGLGISQVDLAELTGIKQASLSQIEANKTSPRKPTLIALSFVLNNDFEEEWLREFFNSSAQKRIKEFDHAVLAELLAEADDLDEQSIKEMRHIWDMLRSEIARRKKS